MSATFDRPSSTARREFLKFLAASPYVAAAGGLGAFLRVPRASAQRVADGADVITNPAGALNVFDFEEAAHRKVSAGHWMGNCGTRTIADIGRAHVATQDWRT
jgi:hypothetical protein